MFNYAINRHSLKEDVNYVGERKELGKYIRIFMILRYNIKISMFITEWRDSLPDVSLSLEAFCSYSEKKNHPRRRRRRRRRYDAHSVRCLPLSLSSKSNELTALVVGVPTNYTKGDIPLIVLRGPRERETNQLVHSLLKKNSTGRRDFVRQGPLTAFFSPLLFY